jgi:LacI family transcriptional regulator
MISLLKRFQNIYIPNEVARNFKMQKSKNGSVFTTKYIESVFSELAYYIEDEIKVFSQI